MSSTTADGLLSPTRSETHANNEKRLSNDIVEKALENDKREGLRLAVKARLIGLAIIAPLLVYLNQNWDVIYYLALLAGFALIGFAQMRIGRVGRSRPELMLLFCDLALLTFTLVYPNPLREDAWPIAMQYRFGGFIYFFFLLAGATLAYSWRTLIAMSVWTSLLWLGAYIWVAYQPVTMPEFTVAVQSIFQGHDELIEFLDPNDPLLASRIQEVIVFAIVAATLAIGGWRSKRLLLHHAGVERERANLARYFSPNVVEELSNNDDPLKQIRTQNIAVLFVDIVGFTSFAEHREPIQVIDTLREFHGRMEQEVFRHHGTLDKYLGDGLMATFGTPMPSNADAGNALRCTLEMIKSIEAWNADRKARGKPELQVGFGLHYGPAVLGDIGANRLEFAVIGSTINIASRLEAMTRELGVCLITSNALVEQVKSEAAFKDNDIAALTPHPPQAIRGLDTEISIWTQKQQQ